MGNGKIKYTTVFPLPKSLAILFLSPFSGKRVSPPLYGGRKRVGFLFLFPLSDGKHVHERTGRARPIEGSMIFFEGLVRITRNG